MQIYDRLFVYGDGALLGEASGVQLEFQGTPQVVVTLVKEFAGVTPVPKSVMITVDNFMPSAGMEFASVKKWLTTQVVTMKVQAGGSGKSYQGDGFLDTTSISSSATDATKLTFKWHGEAKDFS